jgi:hypothetical protein
MATATIQRRLPRFEIASGEVKESVRPSGLPREASIIGCSMRSCEEAEWTAIVARHALLDYFGRTSLAASQGVQPAFGSGATLFASMLAEPPAGSEFRSGAVQSGQLANVTVTVCNNAGSTFLCSGGTEVPFGSILSGNLSLISCHLIQLLDPQQQVEIVFWAAAPPSTRDSAVADFYEPVKYNWSESTYEVDQALRKYSEESHADR